MLLWRAFLKIVAVILGVCFDGDNGIAFQRIHASRDLLLTSRTFLYGLTPSCRFCLVPFFVFRFETGSVVYCVPMAFEPGLKVVG